jgi:hypothetical protein
MKLFAMASLLAACGVDVPPVDPSTPRMSVSFATDATGTTAVTGCWSTSLTCSDGASLELSSASDVIDPAFVELGTDQTGQPFGQFAATTDQLFPTAPIDVDFGGVYGEIALPETFELAAPLATIARGATLRLTWTADLAVASTEISGDYHCPTSAGANVRFATFATDPGTADLAFDSIGGPADRCTLDLVVAHVVETTVANLTLDAKQRRGASIALTP